MYFVYILQNPKDRLYIGQTADLDARIERHNTNRCSSTRNKGPWKLIYSEACASRSLACRRELELKSNKNKEYLIKIISSKGPAVG